MADYLKIDIDKWYELNKADEVPNQELIDYIGTKLHGKYKTAMLSNAAGDIVQRYLSEEHLSVFDTVVISADVGVAKPDPEIFRLTAERLGVSCEECIFIDDYLPYLKGIKKLVCIPFCSKILIKSE